MLEPLIDRPPMQPPRPPRGPAPLNNAVQDALGSVVDRAAALAQLDRQLRQSLPPLLAGQLRLANVAGDRLVFLVDSPIWKTRVRMHADDIIAAAAGLGLQIREVSVKVATMQPPPPVAAPRLPLSEAARKHLAAASSSITDPELRAQFLGLASVSGDVPSLENLSTRPPGAEDEESH